MRYAVWLDERFGSTLKEEVFFARSEDGGQTWGTNKDISLDGFDGASGGYLEDPAISVAPNGHIWVVWGLEQCGFGNCGTTDYDNDVRLARSTDGGATWAEYLLYDGLIPGGLVDVEQAVQIYAYDDRAVVMYGALNQNGIGFDMFVATITPTQTGLSANRIKVSSGVASGRDGSASGLSQFVRMSLAVRGETVCAAWEDQRGQPGGRFAIYGNCSTNGGRTFGADFPITGSDDYLPKLAFAPDGKLYIAYKDELERDIFLRSSADNGASWSAPLQVSRTASTREIFDFDIAVDPNGQIVIAAPIIDFRESDLYLYTSINGGQTFAAYGPVEDGQGRNPTVSAQIKPELIITGDTGSAVAQVVWEDTRNAGDEIWSRACQPR